MTSTADLPSASPLGVLLAVRKPDGETVYLSPELESLLGTSLDALRRPFWSVLGPPESAQQLPGNDFITDDSGTDGGESDSDAQAGTGPTISVPCGSGATLVELHCAGGERKTARMHTVRLPDSGNDIHSFLLDTAQASLGLLNAEQVRWMLTHTGLN